MFMTHIAVSAGVVKDGVLTIGSVSVPIYNPEQKMKVPDVLFYDNPQVNIHFTNSWTVCLIPRLMCSCERAGKDFQSQDMTQIWSHKN